MANINQLANEIIKALNGYEEHVVQGIEEAKDKVSTETVNMLRAESPRKTGAYAKGWTKKQMGTGYVIYNKPHYRLTHLLEKGHAKVGGGRVPPKKVHIKPAEEMAIEKLEQEIRRVVQGG